MYSIIVDKLKSLNDYSEILKQIDTFKSVCIFVDNSGFDIVLGVLPLVVELLKNAENKVILCSNTKSAINDITHVELLLVIKKACLLNETLNHGFNVSKNLILMETGSSSPCLDLSRINIDLARLMVLNRVDLIILEGMGRAVHTNYHAKFKCNSLKVAVLKNQWLAERFGFLGEKKFPIIFKYEKASTI